MSKQKFTIDDVLGNDDHKTFAGADAEKKENKEMESKAEKFDNIKKSLGRPSKSDDEKAKRRVIYYTDEEMEQIESIAKLNGMKAIEWIKFVVQKEIRRERGI